MRRWVSLIAAFGVMMISLAAGVEAQDATPPMGPPESFELAPGVVADSMVFVEGQEAPSLYRLHFDAGVVYAVTPSTSLELAYMEAGSLTAIFDGAVTVGRVGETQTAGQVIDANTEFTLETGQFFVLQPGVGGEVRNTGDQTATLSIAGLTPAGVSMPEASPGA